MLDLVHQVWKNRLLLLVRLDHRRLGAKQVFRNYVCMSEQESGLVDQDVTVAQEDVDEPNNTEDSPPLIARASSWKKNPHLYVAG